MKKEIKIWQKEIRIWRWERKSNKSPQKRKPKPKHGSRQKYWSLSLTKPPETKLLDCVLKRYYVPWKINPKQRTSRHIYWDLKKKVFSYPGRKDHVTYSRKKIGLPALCLKAMLYDRIKCHNICKATEMWPRDYMSSQTGFQIKTVINLPISVVCFRNLQVNELQIARMTNIISVVDAVKIHTYSFFCY